MMLGNHRLKNVGASGFERCQSAGPEAVDRLAEPEIGQHLQLGEADVHAVEVGGDVTAEQQGDETPGDAGVETRLRGGLGG